MAKPVKITPFREHPLPFDTAPEEASSFHEDLIIAANTAKAQAELGAPIEITGNEERQLRTLLQERDTHQLKHQSVALGAHFFLEKYAQTLAFDAARTRVAITNKLLDLADCGDHKIELQALTLLGKHSDIGLFTERSEVTVRHTNADSLEETIKERVARLLHSQVIEHQTLAEVAASELARPVSDA